MFLTGCRVAVFQPILILYVFFSFPYWLFTVPIDASQFSNRGEADLCLAAAIGATDPALARDSGGSCVYLGTRALHITRAVDREQVRVGASSDCCRYCCDWQSLKPLRAV